MKNLNRSSNVPNNNWQILGERKLSVDATMNVELQAWLTEILQSLDLSMDFLSRLRKSVQDSATRAFQAATVMKFEHIHLMIFLLHDGSHDKTWGFFQIEKVGTQTTNSDRYDHSVEFYLYREG